MFEKALKAGAFAAVLALPGLALGQAAPAPADAKPAEEASPHTPPRQNSCRCAKKEDDSMSLFHAVSMMRVGPLVSPIRRCCQTTRSCIR